MMIMMIMEKIRVVVYNGDLFFSFDDDDDDDDDYGDDGDE